jgi:hypothetical protein
MDKIYIYIYIYIYINYGRFEKTVRKCKFLDGFDQTVYKFIDGLERTVWKFTFSNGLFQTVWNY